MKLSQKMRAYTLGLSEDWEYMDKLEADSQMLNDLIEMLFDEDITGLHFGEFNKTFYLYDDTEEKINSNGSTPREAISAAIKGYKK